MVDLARRDSERRERYDMGDGKKLRHISFGWHQADQNYPLACNGVEALVQVPAE